MTKIEWVRKADGTLGETLNPFVGCSVVSAGCKRCYAMRQAERLYGMGVDAYEGTAVNGVWTGRLNRSSDATFQKPLRRKKPQTYFVNSMSDFWHENAKDEWRADALEIMHRCPQHTFQILTKRPENIKPMMGGQRFPANVWIGVSVESRKHIDRIDVLREIPATVRFISAEPLLASLGSVDLDGIAWVIAGAESGRGARPCNQNWVRELRDQCTDSGVAFFYKQHAENGHKLSLPMLDGKVWQEYPGIG